MDRSRPSSRAVCRTETNGEVWRETYGADEEKQNAVETTKLAQDLQRANGIDTMGIAAPVELNGKRGNMAVVVMRTKGNRYKVHRILTPEGEIFALPEMTNAEPTTVGAITSGSQSLGGSAPAISSASKFSIRDSSSNDNPSSGNISEENATNQNRTSDQSTRYSMADEEDATPFASLSKQGQKDVRKAAAAFRKEILKVFPVPKSELRGKVWDAVNDYLETGSVGEELFDWLYENAEVPDWNQQQDPQYQQAWDYLKGKRIYAE